MTSAWAQHLTPRHCCSSNPKHRIRASFLSGDGDPWPVRWRHRSTCFLQFWRGRAGPGRAGRPDVPARAAESRHAQLPGAGFRRVAAALPPLQPATGSAAGLQTGFRGLLTRFVTSRDQVQLLVSESDVENYKQIKADLDELRLIVEKSELWVYKTKTDKAEKKRKKKDDEVGSFHFLSTSSFRHRKKTAKTARRRRKMAAKRKTKTNPASATSYDSLKPHCYSMFPLSGSEWRRWLRDWPWHWPRHWSRCVAQLQVNQGNSASSHEALRPSRRRREEGEEARAAVATQHGGACGGVRIAADSLWEGEIFSLLKAELFSCLKSPFVAERWHSDAWSDAIGPRVPAEFLSGKSVQSESAAQKPGSVPDPRGNN